jgi:signal transduction histidine kinase
MVHVLLNLLRNGLNAVALKGAGNVTIEIEPGEPENAIRVRDTGTGVPPQLLDRIFERVFTYGGETGSSGAGLRFCKLVVERFGGSIQLTSELGQFTEIEIRLPQPEPTNSVGEGV